MKIKNNKNRNYNEYYDKNTNIIMLKNTNIKLDQYLVTYIESILIKIYLHIINNNNINQKLFEALLYKVETRISYNNINKKIVVKKRSSIEHLNNNLKQNRTINV